jgi:hypothetical protein
VRREWWRVIVVAGAVAAAVWPLPPAVADQWFGRAWYPMIQHALTSASNLAPVALLDVLVMLAAGCVVWGAVSVWRSPRGTRGRVALRRLWQGLTVAAAAYLAFLAVWGLNYQRPPITDLWISTAVASRPKPSGRSTRRRSRS